MGFESCHPAVNFLFFAAALYGAVRFDHPVFLAIAYVSAFAYSVRRCGKRAVAVNLFFIPLILVFGLIAPITTSALRCCGRISSATI